MDSLPSTIVFKDMHYFINFMLKLVHFLSRNVRFSSYLRRPAQSRLTPPGVRRKYPEWVKIVENLVGYVKKIETKLGT